MKNNYCLLCKTGDAELRSLSNTSIDTLDKIFPIIEITRGRKLRGTDKHPIENRLKKIYNIFKEQDICLDLTSHPRLLCDEIRELFLPDNGYVNWVNLLNEIEKQGVFSSIIPCLQANFTDSDYEANYKLQAQTLLNKYRKVAYRSSLKEEGYLDDIEIIAPLLIDQSSVVFIIDCEYIPSGSWRSFSEKVVSRIKNVSNVLNEKVEFIICSTSFPNNIGDIGHDYTDSFAINEIDLFNDIEAHFKNASVKIKYGDYGSIGLKRNDDIIMANGWVPRIDVPTEKEIFYIRERRTPTRDYVDTYSHIARKIIQDSRFPKNINCWGLEQIKISADKGAPGASPSFWISVRMNIHITQQLGRLSI